MAAHQQNRHRRLRLVVGDIVGFDNEEGPVVVADPLLPAAVGHPLAGPLG